MTKRAVSRMPATFGHTYAQSRRRFRQGRGHSVSVSRECLRELALEKQTQTLAS